MEYGQKGSRRSQRVKASHLNDLRDGAINSKNIG